MGQRRVVTGHSPDGKAIFVSDEEIYPVSVSRYPGLYSVWAGDHAPTFPDGGERQPTVDYWPPVGGYRFLLTSIAPSDESGERALADTDDLDLLMPGLSDVMEQDVPGMHTSDTVDLEVVLSGEVTLELDGGVTKTMYAGDAIVQNGTRHRWHNHGTEPARMVIILLGAHRQG